MKPAATPFQKSIALKRNTRFPNIWDVELGNIRELARYNFVECHLVLYPKSRKICSKNIAFNPFEEYASDSAGSKSAYERIHRGFHEFFGLILGALIFLLFFLFNPQDLLSVESVVSIFGAYFLGKDFWDDIETLLIGLTKKLPLRYVGDYYAYRLEKHTTLSRYAFLAKRFRYGRETVLPAKMDLIQQSNSQTLRMFFRREVFRSMRDNSAHILSIHLDPALADEFESRGYLFGVKLGFNRRRFLGHAGVEIFQSLLEGKRGCLDERGEWHADAAFFRKIRQCGRIKLFYGKGLIPKANIFV